jgi:integrase
MTSPRRRWIRTSKLAQPSTGFTRRVHYQPNKPFTRESFSNVFDTLKSAMAKEGVDGFICHRLRHTWAGNAHRVGLSILDIQDQGGWKSSTWSADTRSPARSASFAGCQHHLPECSGGRFPNVQ